MRLLKTVRAKLTTLVALSALATLAALPLLHWTTKRQLTDVVDDRLPDAVRGFDLELADDLHDLDAATRTLADSDELERALQTKSTPTAAEELRVFHEAYPGTALVVLEPDGAVLDAVGLGAPPREKASVPSFDALAAGQSTEWRGIVEGGCGAAAIEAPAYVIARRVRAAGVVVACMKLDAAYLANASSKLGVELALVQSGATILTDHFPDRSLARPEHEGGLSDVGDRSWATVRFSPSPLKDVEGHGVVVAAMDMTRIHDVLVRNFAMTIGVLLAGAALAIVMGARLATMMSRALSRLNHAYKRLEEDEYVHVTGVKTGDEIEDLASGFNTMVDGLRERDKLRATMGKYMTRSVMDHLMRGKVELGGESLEVTILFTDIRSFTSISESMSAQELVELLNEYFTAMVTIVMEEDGVVDKYIGDAIMAVFGAPVPKEDDARRAVRAAVRMRKALVDLNERLAVRGVPPIKTGIGIHTGEVVAGNIGSEARMEYTVIGDAVNLASRLEGATKELGADVLVSEDTYADLGDEFLTRAVREITVKGRTKPVVVYEVLGFAQTVREKRR